MGNAVAWLASAALNQILLCLGMSWQPGYPCWLLLQVLPCILQRLGAKPEAVIPATGSTEMLLLYLSHSD